MNEPIILINPAAALKTIFACLFLIGMFLHLLIKAVNKFYFNGWQLTFLIAFLGAIFGGLGYFVVMYG